MTKLYFIIRVTASQEKITADVLQNKISKTNNDVYSLIMPYGMRGYIVIEAANEIACRDLILNEPHVKGMLSKPLEQAELDKMLASRQAIQEIGVSDIVEYFAGPFKGYKAKVLKVDSSKDEITVELMDVAVRIPVTTKANTARIIERANKG